MPTKNHFLLKSDNVSDNCIWEVLEGFIDLVFIYIMILYNEQLVLHKCAIHFM